MIRLVVGESWSWNSTHFFIVSSNLVLTLLGKLFTVPTIRTWNTYLIHRFLNWCVEASSSRSIGSSSREFLLTRKSSRMDSLESILSDSTMWTSRSVICAKMIVSRVSSGQEGIGLKKRKSQEWSMRRAKLGVMKLEEYGIIE